MRTITIDALTPERFRDFGEVLEAPAEADRVYIEAALSNARPEAKVSLSFARTGRAVELPLEAVLMERHRHSSQSFIPLGPCRWLIVVAPQAAGDGRPDLDRARAFEAGPGQGITYRADVWHHPLSVLDEGAAFAILMWRTGGTGDEEFIDLETTLRIARSG